MPSVRMGVRARRLIRWGVRLTLTVQEGGTGAVCTSGPAQNNVNRFLYVEYEYRKWQFVCANWTYRTHYPGVYEWRPQLFTGGNVNTTTSAWGCTPGSGGAQSSLHAHPTWMQRSGSLTYAGLFQLFGIRLDANTATSSSTKYTITPDSGQTAHYCGNDNYPTYAQRAREIS